MNPAMIGEIQAAFETFNTDDEIRVVIIRGEGRVFCAGGDLNWMKDVLGQNEQEVMEDSRHLLNMYKSIDQSPKLVVTAVNGAAIAGALGIVACSDVVIAEAETKLCVSEVKIGLAPGIIAAYILPRIGPSWFRYISKTAILFDAATAQKMGLFHEIVDGEDALDQRIAAHVKLGLGASPDAIERTANLIGELGHKVDEEILNTGLLFNAKARLSPEAQEGIGSFLEKRQPAWVPD
tara:strand:- start:37 stop:744 length:708 start_codon:yes stop_codon:yes gene_type:complete